MSFPIVAAIFKKDLRSLPWLVPLIAALFLADPLIMRLKLVDVWTGYGQIVILVALVVLTISVFQLDSPASLTDDWLCRPVPKRELLTAKFLLIASAVYLPRAVGLLAADLILGYSLPESLLDALLLQDELSLLLLPVMVFTAIITRTFVQAFGVLFAILVALFGLPTPFVRPPGPLTPGLRDELLLSGLQWLAYTPARAVSIALLALAFWLVYWRRQLVAARALMAVTVLVATFLFALPMAFLPWNSVFAIQAAVSPAPPADTSGITLRNTKACLAAARGAAISADPQFGRWELEALRGAGRDSVAFATAIEARGLPLDWRATLNYVQAEYLDAGRPIYSLRPARYSPLNGGYDSLTHAWLLPADAVRRLRGADAQLRLTYSLTLVAPREFRVPTDGERHRLPGLGYCSAVVNEPGNRIDVDCLVLGARPVQVSTQFEEFSGRAYYWPEFSPAFTNWAFSQRMQFKIYSPRMAKHDNIVVTAWDSAGVIQKSLTLPGILGADAKTCPLPGDVPESVQASSWRDAAPHEVRSIGVDEGVQLEVLDFGGTGSPIVLLPGLGATAHSFDDLGPRWARSHRVVAITRRGTGASSRPDFGFETPRLAQDVLRVMDALKIDKALLVGHSIAGDELTWLGGHHADRFRGLVYLDAAYDRSREGSGRSQLREIYSKLPPEPPLPHAAHASYEAMSAELERRGHLRMPEGELIAFFNANDPAHAGMPNADGGAQEAIIAAIGPPDYAAVKVPALAVYAFEDSNKPLPVWYDAGDAGLRAMVAEKERIMDAKKRRDIETFRRQVEHGEVMELANAEHNVIFSNPGEVFEAVEKFDAKVGAPSR